MPNPFNMYFAIKTMMVKKVSCPNCHHHFEVINSSHPRYLTCTKCGKRMKVLSGQAYQMKPKATDK
ncbi:MAG: hypothetical protein ACM3PA_02180 [Methanomassiliicoccales archaeon]